MTVSLVQPRSAGPHWPRGRSSGGGVPRRGRGAALRPGRTTTAHGPAPLSRLVRQLEAELELHTAQFSHDGLESVVDRRLDLVIGRWDFLPAEVDSVVVAHEELLVALPEHHRLAVRERLTADDVAREPWVVLPGRSAATLPNRLHVLGATAGRALARLTREAARGQPCPAEVTGRRGGR